MQSLQNIPRVLTAVAGAIGLVLAAAGGLVTVHRMVAEHTWAFLIAGWALFVVAAALAPGVSPAPTIILSGTLPPIVSFRSRATALLRSKPLWLVTAVALAIAGWRYWETRMRQVPGSRPDPGLISTQSFEIADLFLGRAFGAPRVTAVRPKILQLALSSTKTSLEERPWRDSRGHEVRSFELGADTRGALAQGRCLKAFEAKAPRAREALKRRAEAIGVSQMVSYFDGDNLLDLQHRRPDIVDRLLPRETDWKNLTSADHEVLLDWARSCVGLIRPVFSISVWNPSSKEIVVTGIRYHVESAERERGAISGPMVPLAIYRHVVPAQPGSSSIQSLTPPFRVAAGESAGFELRLDIDKREPGALGLLLKLTLETTAGQLTSERFRVEFLSE